MNLSACSKYFFPALLLASPLLLFPGISIGSSNSVSWFGTGMVVATAIAALLCAPERFAERLERAPRKPAIAFCLLAGIAFWHGIQHAGTYSWRDAASLFLYLFPPLAVCAYAEETKRLLIPFLGILWAWNAAIASMHVLLWRTLPFGIPQNVNWNAAFLLATAPFAIFFIARFVSSRAARLALCCGVVLITAWILFLAGSKGALLALVAAALCTPWKTTDRAARWIRHARWAAGLLCAAAAIFLAAKRKDAIADYLARDERIYLAGTTSAMIAGRPILGYGTPSFEKEYSAFRTPEYFLMRHPAIRTDHPHNEMLYIAAGCGIAGLAAWLVLILSPILFVRKRFQESSLETRLAFFSLIALLVHGQLDLILYRPPTATLAVIFLGILWNEELKPKEEEEDWLPKIPFPKTIRFACVFGGAAVFVSALIASFVDLSASLISREADKAESRNDVQNALRLHARAARLGKDDPNILLAAMEHASFHDPARALEYRAMLEKTSIPDCGYANLIAAYAYLRLNRFSDAVPLLRLESEQRPFSVIPLLMLEHACASMGDMDGAADARRRIEYLKRIRGLTEDDLRNLSKLEDDIQIELKDPL